MTADDFAPFVEAIHGRRPFLWQERLCREIVANRRWPETISVPTGCGKTSVLDIAIFCLALQGESLPGLPGADRWARVRTIFCVDRRLVVDEAYDHAEKIACKLNDPVPGILTRAAASLLLYGGQKPLEIARLRGGMFRQNTWVDHPNQPLIVLSTVDQTGSRLLFRGYQVSDGQKPVHAGLLGLNSQIVVDEAHLSMAFLDSLKQIGKLQSSSALAPPLAFTQMSATVHTQTGDRFEMSASERAEEIIAERVTASKLTELEEVRESSFTGAAVERARQLAKSVRVVGIVVNQVRTARTIFEVLRKDRERQAILLTGRIRPYDRDRLLTQHFAKICVNSTSIEPISVVATQTVEVGANIDFDALVTEAAPIASLRQRFGRLHRLGNRGRGPAEAAILRRKTRDDDDPVYGLLLKQTWDWLIGQSAGLPGGKIDFGFAALNALHPEDSLPAPPRSELAIQPCHLDAWIQTNPRPFPDPDVAPFLHDEEDALADVQIVWRSDLLVPNNGEHDDVSRQEWVDAVLRMPPKLAESLPVPFWAVRRWLSRHGAEAAAVSDQEGAGGEPEQRDQLRPFVAWRGPDDCIVEENNLLHPGDTVVVPCSYGGCDEFGWHPESNAEVVDVGNDAAVTAPGLVRVRFTPKALPAPRQNEAAALLVLYRKTLADEPFKSDELLAQIDAMVAACYPDLEWCRTKDYLVYAAKKPARVGPLVEPGQDDTDGDALGATPVTLVDHTNHVTAEAVALAKSCGLPTERIEDFEIAGLLHDLGKADPRFQQMCRAASGNGDLPDVVLAKSGASPSLAEQRRLAAQAGYPHGYRHEILSVAMAAPSQTLAESNDPDLVLHLIGSHHGHGRALAPVAHQPEPISVSVEMHGETFQASTAHGLERLDSGWTERFLRLNEKYGRWGLAYLEAIFRRADCLASKKEEERKAGAS